MGWGWQVARAVRLDENGAYSKGLCQALRLGLDRGLDAAVLASLGALWFNRLGHIAKSAEIGVEGAKL